MTKDILSALEGIRLNILDIHKPLKILYKYTNTKAKDYNKVESAKEEIKTILTQIEKNLAFIRKNIKL